MGNLDIIRGRQVILTLTNRSGGALNDGDVVIVDIANDESFTTTVVAGSLLVMGVVQEDIANLAAGRVLVEGYAAVVEVNDATARGDFLKTSTVATRATSQATMDAGVFAKALSSTVGAGQVSAELFGVDSGAGGGGGGATIHTSAYAAPPGAPAAGDLWLPSDSFYLLRYTGAAWVPWGPIFPHTMPDNTAFAWINQGAASVDATKGGIYLLAPALAGTNLKIRKKAAPGTPYTITACFLPQLYAVNYQQAGLLFRESGSGKLATVAMTYSSGWKLPVEKFTNPTTYSANYLTVDSLDPTTIWLRIADDGVNRICSWSMDGQFWMQIHSVGRADFLTADEVGFFTCPTNATWPSAMTLLSWQEA